MAEKPRLGILENAPPWWPNFEPPDFTEEDLLEIERYCKKIVENVNKEKAITPLERWKITRELGIPDRPVVYNMPLNLAVSRVLDCWSDSLKPGIDMWWYPKLCLKGHFAWVARFNVDCIFPYIFTYGDTEWGGSSKAKLLPYAAPAWIEPAVKTEADLDRIHIPDVHRDGYYPPSLWMIRKTKEFMKKHGVADIMPLWSAFCGGPFAGPHGPGGLGLKQGFIALRRNPEILHKLAKIHVKHDINFGKAVLEAGADAMFCCEWPGIAGLELYKPFDPYLLEVTKALTPPGFFWAFGFDQSPTLEYQCQTGSIGLGWICTHETPKEICREIATKYKKVYANFFDPLIAVHGPAEKIVAAVKDNISAHAGTGYMFMHSAVDYWAPQEYVDLVVKTAKEHGKEVYKGLR